MSSPLICRNADHPPRPASVFVSWPDKRFRPDKDPACRSCLQFLTRTYVYATGDEQHPMLIEPIEGAS